MATETSAAKPQIASGIVAPPAPAAPKLTAVKKIADGPIGQAVDAAPTIAAEQNATADLAKAINKFASTDILHAAPPAPVTATTGNSPQDRAAQKQSEAAAKQFDLENKQFDSAIRAKVTTNLTLNTTAPKAEEAADEIARMNLQRQAVQKPFVETAKADTASPANPASKSFGDGVLDGTTISPKGRPGPGAAASPASGGNSEPEKAQPSAAAPAAVGPSSGGKDAAFSSVTDQPPKVKASVGDYRQTVSASPIVVQPVEKRPAGRLKAVDAKFEEVPVSKPVNGATSLAAVAAKNAAPSQPVVLGITQQTSPVIDLGTISVADAAKQKQAVPVAGARPSRNPQAKSVSTAGVGGRA